MGTSLSLFLNLLTAAGTVWRYQYHIADRQQ